MELTEQWIGKIAGWKMLKAGRDLWKAGNVKEVKANENETEIIGIVGSGEKPRRVKIIIHGENDIENKCACMHSRRTGEVCSHVVAMLLHYVNGEELPAHDWQKPKKSKQEEVVTFTPQRLEVQLPPNFPKGIDSSLSVRLIKLEGEPEVSDIRLCAWVSQIGLEEIPSMLSLKGEQITSFIDAVASNEVHQAGEREVKVSSSVSRLPVDVVLDEGKVYFTLLKSAESHAYTLGNAAAIWEDSLETLYLVKAVRGVMNTRFLGQLISGSGFSLTTKEFVKNIKSWEEVLDWGRSELFDTLKLVPANVQFVLQLEGSLNSLTAKLMARYPGGVKVSAGETLTSDAFPIQDRNQEGLWLIRNEEEERGAKRRLFQYGFDLEDNGRFSLRDQEEVLDFLGGGLSELRREWTIEESSGVKSSRSNVVRIKPDIKLEGSGEDWLAFDYGFQTDEGKPVPREAIEKMLKAGKRSASIKNGKRIVISDFDAEVVGEVLRDVNPRQENGKYFVSPNQGAYLKRLKAYYGKSNTMTSEGCIQKLPKAIQQTLREYQREGIAWLHQRMKTEKAALLADDMGLGKTLQTLSLIHLIQQEEKAPALVVCPTSLLENWSDEIKNFFPEASSIILHGTSRSKHFADVPRVNVVITSYALIVKDLEFYQSQNFSVIVIDEASVIRNADTQAAKALRKLQIPRRLALTGTPVENALQDLWSIFEFMMPSYLGGKEDFKKRYVNACSGSSPDKSALKRLRMRIEPFMFRRTKQQVAKDLPAKIEQIVWCQPTPQQVQTYQAVHKQGLEQVQESAKQGAGRAKLQMLTVLLRMRQACCDLRLLGGDDFSVEEASAKMVRLIELVKQAKDGGHRMLIFSQFTTMLGLIKESLDILGADYCYLDGATRNRGEVVKKFQKSNGPTAFLISLKAGGYGLNLTAADVVVHFDPWWNPAVEAQATDRAYRIGQTKPVNVYKLVTTGTVEEKIIKLQEKKRALIDATVDDENLMEGLSQTDVESLFDS